MRRVLAVTCLLVIGAGCGDADPAIVGGRIDVTNPWARATAFGQTVGAVYFEIEASGDDTLETVAVPAAVAAGVEIHETVTDEVHGASGGDSAVIGQMSMRELDHGLPLPAGTTVSVAPGGYHLMLVELARPLAAGTTFPMTLRFEHADPMTVDVPVLDAAP